MKMIKSLVIQGGTSDAKQQQKSMKMIKSLVIQEGSK